MQVAVWLNQQPNATQGILAIQIPRITIQRVKEAYAEALAALRPEVADRLAIVAFAHGTTWMSSPSSDLEAIARAALQIESGPAGRVVRGSQNAGPAVSFDVMKVLLEAWLRREGPLRIQEIMQRAGCSHPTVSLALEHLDRRGEVDRSKDRRAELRGLPKRTLEEAAILSESLRQTMWLIDVSGRAADPARLRERLERAKPAHVAFGGVVAARHYHPEFDLNGIPRIDLTIWAPRGGPYEPTRLLKADAGLIAVPSADPRSVAAIHRLSRAQSLFQKGPHAIPYADPVEVLLDLYELRLESQAQAFTQHLRGDAS
ncbi:MAG: hypothetical protein ABJB05_16960 [Parafilimonas sp.]